MNDRQESYQQLKKKHDRLLSLINNTTEAIYCFEYEHPISISLPIDVQVEQFYNGVLVECNSSFANDYGAPGAEKILGLNLADLFGKPPSMLDDLICDFIRSEYHFVDRAITEKFFGAPGRHIVNNSHAVIENGALLRIWGSYRDVTERKQAEKDRDILADQLRTLLENSPDFLYFKDTNRRFVRASKTFCDLFNCSLKDIIGKRDEDLFPQHVAGDTVADDLSVIETGQPLVNREEGGGELPWVMTTKLPWYDSNGQIKGLYGITRDITQKKLAEDALRRSEEQYRKLVEICPDMVSVTIDGKLEYVNPAFVKTYGGTDPSQFVGRKIEDFIHPEDHAQIRERIKKQLKTGRPVSSKEVRLTRLDGSTFVGESAATPFLYKGTTAIQAVIRDITERKKTDDALRESEERFRILSELAYEGVAIHEKGIILEANHSLAQMFGYQLSEIIGMSTLDMTTPELRNKLLNNILSGDEKPYEGLGLKKDGSTFPVEVSGKNIIYKGRKARVAALRDVTERKRAEEERLKLEKKIHHTQKLESLGILAGGIAHDFNNLLMGVLGNADLSLSILGPESPIKPIVQRIQTAGIRLAELTNQMLTYAGKGKFETESVDLSNLLKEMINLLESSISKKVELRLQLDHNPSSIKGDPTQIRQVIMNLVTNAAEAYGEKNGIVTVKTSLLHMDRSALKSYLLAEELPGGEYILLEVSDTGCGMDEDACQKMFDPFFSTKFTGRGLGMSAVVGTIRRHGGAIKVNSEPNKGTTIKVPFPLEEVECKEFQVVSSDESLTFQGQGKVLVVDDDETVLSTTGFMLEQLGFYVLTATNGIDGLQKVCEQGNDLVCVLLDFTMPHMDGFDVFCEIRKIHPDLSVILCSGYNQREITRKFTTKDYHLSGFLQKPFRYNELAEKLRNVLTRSGKNELPRTMPCRYV